MIKKIKESYRERSTSIISKVGGITLGLGVSATNVLAAGSGTESIDGIVKFICDWAGKFGLVIALIGGIQLALAFKNDDANAKTNGVRMVVAGLMVVAISKTPGIVGL